MTTDITELAQSLKAAAARVIKNYDSEWFEAGHQICTVHKSKINLISLANPVNVLALVEALEKAQQFIARQGKILLNQDESLSIRRGELEFTRRRIAELESRTVTPVNYSDNTDADHCRKWAWQQVKGEVSTEGWTSGDNANYFGFFCWGWDMRRQYNEQRPINVKLPKTMYTEFDGDDYCREVAVLDKQQVIDCLRAAGIKVEAE